MSICCLLLETHIIFAIRNTEIFKVSRLLRAKFALAEKLEQIISPEVHFVQHLFWISLIGSMEYYGFDSCLKDHYQVGYFCTDDTALPRSMKLIPDSDPRMLLLDPAGKFKPATYATHHGKLTIHSFLGTTTSRRSPANTGSIICVMTSLRLLKSRRLIQLPYSNRILPSSRASSTTSTLDSIPGIRSIIGSTPGPPSNLLKT